MTNKDVEKEPIGIWFTGLADVIDYENIKSLWEKIFSALVEYVDITSISLICYQRNSAPRVLISTATDDLFDDRIQAYVMGRYLLDPFFRACMYDNARGICTLSDVAPAGFKKSQYFQTFFSAYGLEDEINILNWIDKEVALALSFGRPTGKRRFGKTSIDRLRELEPLLSEISRRSWQKQLEIQPEHTDTISQIFHARLKIALENFGTSVLTNREKDVLDHLLLGYSVKSAANQLGVKDGTVRIHRHSIYKKLDIGSQTELFSLILECLRQTTDDMSEDPLRHMMPPEY